MADDATAVVEETATEQTATTETTAETKTETTAETKATETTPDWRSDVAGEDPELLKFLGRYHSKDAFAKGFRDLYGQFRSGKLIKPVDENSSDEERAAFNKMLGVPEKPEEYLTALKDGLVVGDDDKPIVNEFLDAMHKAGAPKAVTAAAVETYYAIVEKQTADATEADRAAKQASEDALREEWGADYRRNVNITDAYLDTLPASVKETLTGGFGPDGVALFNNAEVVKFFTSLALEANPVATVVPGAGANQASAVSDEITKIEEVMRTNRAAYNRDEKMQARLRELYSAREKLK